MSNTFDIPPMADANSLEAINKKRTELLAAREKIAAELKSIEIKKEHKVQSIVNDIIPAVNAEITKQLNPGETLHNDILTALMPAITERVNQLFEEKKTYLLTNTKIVNLGDADHKVDSKMIKVMKFEELDEEMQAQYISIQTDFSFMKNSINPIYGSIIKIQRYICIGSVLHTPTSIIPYRLIGQLWDAEQKTIFLDVVHTYNNFREEMNVLYNSITCEELKHVRRIIYEFAIESDSCFATQIFHAIRLTKLLFKDHKRKCLEINNGKQYLPMPFNKLRKAFHRAMHSSNVEDPNYKLFDALSKEHERLNNLVKEVWSSTNFHKSGSIYSLHGKACQEINALFPITIKQETKLPTWEDFTKD